MRGLTAIYDRDVFAYMPGASPRTFASSRPPISTPLTFPQIPICSPILLLSFLGSLLRVLRQLNRLRILGFGFGPVEVICARALGIERERMSFQDLESGRPLIVRRQDSTQAVAAGLFQITTSVRNFERLVSTIGTPKDTPDLREKLHNARLHIGQLVKDASTKLKQATETDHLSEASTSKRITDAKLAKDFQNILKEYQKLQRLAAERETAFAPLVPQAVLPPRQAVVFNLYDSMGVPDNTSNKPLEQALLLESKRQEVLLLDNEIVFNEAIIEEREQAIQDIQQQIGEVNEIFKDLAVLVHDQGVIIDDISSHIENSHAATAQGTIQLQKAAKTQKSNSSLVNVPAFGDFWDYPSHCGHSCCDIIHGTVAHFNMVNFCRKEVQTGQFLC
ncbi:hypothetical protein ZIOFF_070340 [Zingiber officinale]|uniref:t-SNARE coiled-coil homology domain-containing protein n=1 Tax=Zingiber officinale TaxID=94328 RepID=A0A8J5CEH0_ZINOF|nr:hypothetical protein ZIOFF_070340 [Zingiber officinale]